MQEIIDCPVCRLEKWQPVFQVTDHSISKEKFHLIKCSNCGFIITSPQPDSNILSRYYQSQDYISHSGKSSNLVNWIYLQARKFSLRWKRKIIHDLKPTGSLLDIGCGTGEFLKTIKENGWEIAGVEPSEAARKNAELLLHQSISEKLENATGQFDIITLWHVFEHFTDLNGSIEKINQLLKPDGKLLIAVPNHSSADAIEYNTFWAGYDVPRHLWHFNKKVMALFLLKHSFTLEKTIPMKLDAYYVSMLSEKYSNPGKNGIGNLIKGFINGFQSNQKAKQSGEYSSLIYIARK